MDVTRLALRHELKSKSAGATSNWTAENEEDYLNRLADKYFDPTQGYRAVIAQIKKAVTSSILELRDGSSNQTSCLLHLKLVTLDALDVPPNNSKKAQRRGIGFVHYDN
jgi:hypothetical protein